VSKLLIPGVALLLAACAPLARNAPAPEVRTVTVDAGMRVSVPRQAVRRNAQGQHFVWIVGEGGELAARVVETGAAAGDRVVLTSGLSAGDRVVIGGPVKPSQSAVPGQSRVAAPTAAERARRPFAERFANACAEAERKVRDLYGLP
jgi:hypothetical protein